MEDWSCGKKRRMKCKMKGPFELVEELDSPKAVGSARKLSFNFDDNVVGSLVSQCHS